MYTLCLGWRRYAGEMRALWNIKGSRGMSDGRAGHGKAAADNVFRADRWGTSRKKHSGSGNGRVPYMAGRAVGRAWMVKTVTGPTCPMSKPTWYLPTYLSQGSMREVEVEAHHAHTRTLQFGSFSRSHTPFPSCPLLVWKMKSDERVKRLGIGQQAGNCLRESWSARKGSRQLGKETQMAAWGLPIPRPESLGNRLRGRSRYLRAMLRASEVPGAAAPRSGRLEGRPG